MQEQVTFESDGLKLSGVIHIPDGYDGTPLPAFIVCHPPITITGRSGLIRRGNGRTGSTNAACWSPWGALRPPKPRQVSTPLWNLKSWPRN